MATFNISPYDADLNPGDPSEAKLVIKASREDFPDKEKITIRKEDAPKIQAFYQKQSRHFGWGPLANAVPKQYRLGADGSVNGRELKSILINFRQLSLKDVQAQALETWGTFPAIAPPDFEVTIPDVDNRIVRQIDPAGNANDRPLFYRRVKSQIIAKAIENTMKPASFKTLELRKSAYQWYDQARGEMVNDGPTMLHLILSSINPSTKVGNSTLKLSLSSARLSQYNNELDKMLDAMQATYDRIIENNGSHEDFMLNIYQALTDTKTVHCEDFRLWAGRQKDLWESDKPDALSIEALIAEAKQKYTDLVEASNWSKSNATQEKIMALTTQVTNLQNQLNPRRGQRDNQRNGTGRDGSSGSNSNRNSSREGGNGPDAWRTKKRGDTTTRDGNKFVWCSQHKIPLGSGSFSDGIYMPEGHNHEEWAAAKAAKKAKFAENKSNGSSDASNGEGGRRNRKLTLGRKLQAALVTQTGMSEADASKLWTDVAQGN